MKKILLIAATTALSLFSANAQRFSIYEEFSGENCNPCAQLNPALWTLMNAGTNPSKVILLKYQSPIPSAGPIYNQYRTVTDNRMSYYSVPFAPYGRLNGTVQGNGNISNLTQNDIDGAATQTSAFSITLNGAWSTNGSQVTATVNVTALTNFSPSAANLKLRIALIQTLEFDKAPGSNGEKVFHNVVREMLPDANGTALNSTWTATENQQFTINTNVKSFIDKSNEVKLVAWIQDDLNKVVLQAVVSNPLPSQFATDATVSGFTAGVPAIGCAGTTMTPKVNLTNVGTSALTAATIFYRLGTTSAWASKAWTGSLATNASAEVSLDPTTIPSTSGTLLFQDSVVVTGDINGGNNTASSSFTSLSTTPVSTPVINTWETGVPTGWSFYDSDGSGQTWVNGQGTNLAFNRSTYMSWYKVFEFTAGSSSMMIVPTPAKVNGAASMNFRLAYAMQTPSNTDKLEVVTSTDCGATWTALWTKTGSALMTTPQFQIERWLPNPVETNGIWDWRLESVDLGSLANNAIIGFRATAGGGANLFIDDIELKGKAASVKEEIKYNSIALSPNPAANTTTLGFELLGPATVSIEVYDISGRLVLTSGNQSFGAGKNEFELNTTTLETGLYSVKMTSANETMTQKLMIAK